jgi:hypothetical protein
MGCTAVLDILEKKKKSFVLAEARTPDFPA